MGFNYDTWANSFGRAWGDAWGKLTQTITNQGGGAPIAPREKEEFFEEELALLLYASKY